MPKGLDKGYDVFIELAHLLSAKYKFVNFHIIGGFDENDIDITKIKDNVTFYGYRPFEELQYFFSYIDILVSPNKSFVLNEGSFDGFPLGTVIEAALNGVLAVVTDDLKQNSIFINNKHLLIVESNSSKIENAITYLINNPDKFADISINGKSKFQEVYSNSFQMNPRVKLLTKLIQEHK
jgi:glycosyltransferase involved in cell wall biosynthesis